MSTTPEPTDESRRESIRKEIGELIRERREARGLGLTELGRLFEDARAPSRWHDYKGVRALEHGEAGLRLEDLQVLADVLGDPVELYLTPLLPTGVSISPEEAHERARLAYRDFLDRSAKRVESAVSQTMDDPEFRLMIGWLAELSPARRQTAREVIRGLRRNEQEDRFARRPAVESKSPIETPAGSDVTPIAGYQAAAAAAKKRGEPFRPVNQRAAKTSKGGSRKR